MSLLTSLVSYWKLDEASGTRYDSHGTNDLTDNGSVSSTTGKLNSAGSWDGGSRYLSHSDNSDLSTGDIDFTFTAWVKFTDIGQRRFIIGKDDSTSGNREYTLFYHNATDRIRFDVFTATDSDHFVLADSLGSPSTGTWYFIVAWYDSTANTLNIQINNGTVDTTSGVSSLQSSGAAEFRLGARSYSGIEDYHDGLIDEVGFWKRVLTSDERTRLYNSGAGLDYSSFGASVGGIIFPSWRRGSLTLRGM